jgi:hypothetical protein
MACLLLTGSVVARSFFAVGRVGAVQGVQEEHRAAISGRRQQTGLVGVHGDRGRRSLYVHGGRALRRVRRASAEGRVRQRRRAHVTFGGGGVHRAAATGTRDLLLQRAGGSAPEPTLHSPLGARTGTWRRRHGVSCLAVLADAVRRRHAARPPAGRRRVAQQSRREEQAERRGAGHRRHLGGEPSRDLLVAAAHEP